MLSTTLRLALRRLARRPSTSALHVGGLAVGLACCLLALLFVRDELSYDRFHEGAHRIVDIKQGMTLGDRKMAFSMMPKGGREALREGVPGVEAMTSTGIPQGGLVRRIPGDEGIVVEEVRFADAAFFDVFAFPMTRGDARTALDGPNQAVLTASLAETLFDGRDPIGQSVYLERTGFGLQDPEPIAIEVTGVAADPPSATTVGFDVLVSGTTLVASFEGQAPAVDETSATFVRLASLRDTVAVKAVLDPLALAGGDGLTAMGARHGIMTPRLVDRHLASRRAGQGLVGDPLYLVLFLTSAALVLVLACVNYANLATALALRRATEVGVRKTLGAGRGQLVRLFLAEAVVLALVAGAAAVGLVALVLPAFNAFFGKGVSLAGLGVVHWGAVAALVIGTGVLAGAYPAAVLARFQPVTALRGAAGQGRRGAHVRQALVVFQFAVTAILLTATAVVAQQMDAARARDLGFEGDRVVAFELQSERLGQLADVLEQEVEGLPGVTRASLGSGVPGNYALQMGISPAGTHDDPSDDLSVAGLDADEDYAGTFGLELAAGAWFAPGAVDRRERILNETAARRLGLMTTDATEALGKEVGSAYSEATSTVVGVVEDFHFKGPRVEIEPLVIQPKGPFHNTLVLSVQLASTDARALNAVREVWERLAPEYPFAPQFVSDTFAEQLRADRQLGQLFGVLGLVAVVLAGSGVFGLAAHAAERRTKEIGVRKVLGASVAGIVARLSGEFARLVLVALVVATPVAVVLARRWLDGFAYPAPLSAGPFLAVGLGVLVLALAVAGVHAVRAATADPVRALRSE